VPSVFQRFPGIVMFRADFFFFNFNAILMSALRLFLADYSENDYVSLKKSHFSQKEADL
jgi:hypothetical protein